jgi:hypothetical protein
MRATGRFGDPGFYRIVSTGPNRWSVRYLPKLHENFHVYVAPDGALRSEHEIRIAGVRTLTLHYKMPLARSAAASV